jgi:hypothetical protein
MMPILRAARMPYQQGISQDDFSTPFMDLFQFWWQSNSIVEKISTLIEISFGKSQWMTYVYEVVANVFSYAIAMFLEPTE